jgi:hypothetical protein
MSLAWPKRIVGGQAEAAAEYGRKTGLFTGGI